MSFQQVNLYQDELRNKKTTYSATMLLQACVAIIIVLSIFSGFKSFQLQQKQDGLVIAKKELSKLNAEKSKIEAKKEKEDATLARKITAITKELVKKQKVVKILNQDEFGNAEGFVGYIGGLARQRLEGLWLTHITLASGGTDITLRGSTKKAVLLPKYLQRLSAESAFSGVTFQHFLMSENKDKKSWLDFSLQNVKASKDIK